MAIKVVSISQLMDKDLFASPGKNVNVRSGVTTKSTLLATIKGGDKIGTVDTYAEGKDAQGNKDGSVWLQLKQTYSNPSGFGAWVKYMPGVFDWSALKQQGAQTVEEVKQAEVEKNKTTGEKILDQVKEAGKWLLIGFVVKVLSGDKK